MSVTECGRLGNFACYCLFLDSLMSRVIKNGPFMRIRPARLLLPWPRVRSRLGRPSRRTEWRQGLGLLIDAMDRGVEDLGPEPPAWWQRGQPMQLTMATVAEHVVVQEDIVMAAVAEPAGDEPAAAGDGAGDDEPVKYKFIKTTFIKKKNFIKIHFHQKPISSKNHFDQNPFSSRTIFIKNHFHQKPLSSKTTFIKNHFHQKPFSSKTTFIKNHFHQKTPNPKDLNPKDLIPKPKTLNPKPQSLKTKTVKTKTLNPKPKTLNPKPKTLNPKP